MTSTALAALVGLAGSPDDSPAVDTYLRELVEIVPRLVDSVDYASVTVRRDGTYSTPARSDELAVAVDEAQYAADEGPCLDALEAREPVGVEYTPAGENWPRFREKAYSVGVYASLSIPLFTAGGAVVAALNLYARDPAAMAGLIARVVDLFHGSEDPATDEVDDRPPLDPGGAELVEGLRAALRVHDDIQHALGMLMGRRQLSAAGAYATLCEIAAKEDLSLHAVATGFLDRLEA
jgi:hypothetical protein